MSAADGDGDSRWEAAMSFPASPFTVFSWAGGGGVIGLCSEGEECGTLFLAPFPVHLVHDVLNCESAENLCK